MRLVRVAALAAVAAALAAPTARADVGVDLAGGEHLVVQASPFRVVLTDAAGHTEVATVPGTSGPPVRVPGLDGPQPIEPLGALGAFPALGFVVGIDVGLANPAPPFTGNRLFGAEAGVVVSITGIGAVTRTASGAHLELTTDAPSAGPAVLDIVARPGGGARLTLRPPADLPDVASTMTTLQTPAGEGLYGLGTRRDAFDQRGLLRNVWNDEQYFGSDQTEPITGLDPTGTTGPAYTAPNGAQMTFFAQPEVSGSRGWTAWISQTELQRVDLAASRADALRWAVAADHLTLTLAGGGLERSVAAYTAEAGRAPAPPRYVYAPWLDRINQNGEGEAAPNGGGYNGGPAVKADLPRYVQKIHDDGLPITTFGVEGWHAVPGGDTFFPGLRRQGFDLVAYWNPYLAPGKPATDEALKLGVVIRDPSGNPYPIITNRQNVSYAVDFSNPGAQAFWNRQIARSCDIGFEGTHADFGEFVTDGMRFADGTPPAVMHNRYGVLYARATRIALDACAQRHPGLEPFFYVRTGFGPVGDGPGSLNETPAVIIGDESTDWSRGSGIASVPPAMLNLAMGGGTTFISDVGGYFDLYTPSTTAELFTRWAQLSALTPVMRIHDDTQHGSRYPWDYDAAALDAYRRYARLKVRLVPVVDRWARRAARDGTIGPVRPLILDDPSPAARAVADEWLLGADVLAAPVIVKGATSRRVYLPAGADWQRVTIAEDGAFIPAGGIEAGGRTVTAPAPLTDIPVYLRVVRPGLVVRCAGRGGVRAMVRGDDLRGVTRVRLLARRRRVARADAAPLSRVVRRGALRAARSLVAELRLEEGRTLRVRARIPRRCG